MVQQQNTNILPDDRSAVCQLPAVGNLDGEHNEEPVIQSPLKSAVGLPSGRLFHLKLYIFTDTAQSAAPRECQPKTPLLRK